LSASDMVYHAEVAGRPNRFKGFNMFSDRH
jgi:hypothetical protein